MFLQSKEGIQSWFADRSESERKLNGEAGLVEALLVRAEIQIR
jgi:hypothetical protein